MKNITQEQMDDVFEHLSTVILFCATLEKQGDEKMYREFYHEFVGIYSTIVGLGLLSELDKWRVRREKDRNVQ